MEIRNNGSTVDFVPSWEKEQQDQDYLSIQEWNDKYGFVESEY